MEVSKAIQSRNACRAFLDKPVANDALKQILSSASWAPSGINSQPWQVAVIKGKTKQSITETLIQARTAKQPPDPDYAYYPDEWFEPYQGRRIACGKALYEAIGIRKGDDKARQTAWENNYRFFNAPIGLLFFIDRRMNKGSWVDMGMFMQNIMLAAIGLGLATCPQASLADYPNLIRKTLDIKPELALVCGMALGYPDLEHPVNQYRLERAPVDEFCRWYE